MLLNIIKVGQQIVINKTFEEFKTIIKNTHHQSDTR